MTSYIQDLVFATRALLKARAFLAVCVTSLGLGMSVVIAIMLMIRLLTGTPPGVNDDGLVELVIRPSGELRAAAGTSLIDTWSYPDYLDVREATSGMAITGWSRGDALFRPPDRGAVIPGAGYAWPSRPGIRSAASSRSSTRSRRPPRSGWRRSRGFLLPFGLRRYSRPSR